MSILSRLRRAAVALLTPDDQVRERVDLMKAIIQMESHFSSLIKRLEMNAARSHDDWSEAVDRIVELEEELSHAQQDKSRLEVMQDEPTGEPDRLPQMKAALDQARAQLAAAAQSLEAAEQTERAMDEIGHLVGLTGMFETADIVTAVRDLVSKPGDDEVAKRLTEAEALIDHQAQTMAQLKHDLGLKDAYIEAQRRQLDTLREQSRGPRAHIVTDDEL